MVCGDCAGSKLFRYAFLSQQQPIQFDLRCHKMDSINALLDSGCRNSNMANLPPEW